MISLLAPGTPTGLCDKNGREICIGDHLIMPTECNQEFHGDYSLYKVEAQGVVPILTYVQSHKGKLLPEGYLAVALSAEYDAKNFLWANDSKTLRPTNALEVIKDWNDG